MTKPKNTEVELRIGNKGGLCELIAKSMRVTLSEKSCVCVSCKDTPLKGVTLSCIYSVCV